MEASSGEEEGVGCRLATQVSSPLTRKLNASARLFYWSLALFTMNQILLSSLLFSSTFSFSFLLSFNGQRPDKALWWMGKLAFLLAKDPCHVSVREVFFGFCFFIDISGEINIPPQVCFIPSLAICFT